MANLQMVEELKGTERAFGLNLLPARQGAEGRDDAYFARFETELRKEAAATAQHYEVFCCLEDSIRDFISDILGGAFGLDWWGGKIDQGVRDEANRNQTREEELGMTPRSERPIDYVTFGQLGKMARRRPSKSRSV